MSAASVGGEADGVDDGCLRLEEVPRGGRGRGRAGAEELVVRREVDALGDVGIVGVLGRDRAGGVAGAVAAAVGDVAVREAAAVAEGERLVVGRGHVEALFLAVLIQVAEQARRARWSRSPRWRRSSRSAAPGAAAPPRRRRSCR
ncbi:MAG: hypothetical protein V9F03_05275 [Microthrixaceae bacterium]